MTEEDDLPPNETPAFDPPVTRYYVNQAGGFISGFSGVEPPAGSVEVPEPPEHGSQIWDMVDAWLAAPVAVPDRVSARQLRMQLRASGLLETVTAWVAAQNGFVQDSFEYSDSFVRTEPMMQSGFAALGFTEEQIDAFFAAAAAL